MINFLAEVSKRSAERPLLATPSTRWGRQYNIYEIYLGKHPQDTYWIDWGGWYDNPENTRIEIYINEWLQAVYTETGLLDQMNSLFVEGDYVYIHIPKHSWLYDPWENIMAYRVGYLYAAKNSDDPSDLFLEGELYETRLGKPSITIKLSDPIAGLVKYSTFNISLTNNDGLFDGEEIEAYFNTPAYIRKTTKDHAEYEDFIPIRAGMIEDITVSSDQIEISVADKFRTLDEAVCKTIQLADYLGYLDTDMQARAKDDVDGKLLPVVFGRCTMPLIELDEVKFEPAEDILGNPAYDVKVPLKADFLVGEGVTAIVGNEVYTEEGEALACSFDSVTGIIKVNTYLWPYLLTGIGTDGKPEYDKRDTPKPKYAVVDGYAGTKDGYKQNSVGGVIRILINRSMNQKYNDSNWDTLETTPYINDSPLLNIAITTGNINTAITETLKSDMAFMIQKQDGRFTLRKWGESYGIHHIPSWTATQKPQKDYSQAQQQFSSSSIIYYDYDDYQKTHTKQYLYTDREREARANYLKQVQKEYKTYLASEADARNLAIRIGHRFCELRETISIGVGADCSQFNLLDTVIMEINTNGRSYSSKDTWIIRELDPAQDKLVLEEA